MIFNMCVFNVFPPPNMLWADSQCFASVSEFELLIKVTQFPTVGKSRLFTWWLILKHDYSTKYDNVKRIYPGGEKLRLGIWLKVVEIKLARKKILLPTLTLRWRYPTPSPPQGEIFTQETICLRERINICLKYLLPTCHP